MNEDRVASALMELTRQQGATTAALEAMAGELRRGFERGTERMDAADRRLHEMERREARRTGVAGAGLALVSFLGAERLLRAFGVDL